MVKRATNKILSAKLEERARQAEHLRTLDLKLVQAVDLHSGMQAIVDCACSLLEPDQCHIRFRQGDVLSLMAVAGEGLQSRVRETVSVQHDKDVSVSAAFADSGHWEQPVIFGPEKLKAISTKLRVQAHNESAAHFEALKSCGAFGLRGTDGDLIGVLVVESREGHYFDKERAAIAQGLVARAQALLAHHLSCERLRNLVNSLDSEVVVVDRNANVLLCNQAWSRRAGMVQPKPEMKHDSFSYAMRCSIRSSSLLQSEVASVFEKREPTKLIAEFDAPDGRTQHMAVRIASLERNALGGVETVMAVMSDVTDLVSMESISQNAVPHPDIGRALVEPLKTILVLFGAARASVAECVLFDLKDSGIRVRCRVDDSGAADSMPNQLPVVPQIGELLHHLRGYGYLAVTNVDSTSTLPNEEIRALLRKGGTQSLLAAPIYLSGEPWGVLTVSFKHRRTFSGQDVHLLRAAATQLSVLILLSQLAELRSMDRDIAAAIGRASKFEAEGAPQRDLLSRILRQAILLTGANGGHIRAADWNRCELILQAAESDPLVQPGMPLVRERVHIGEPVAGEVALTGEPTIKNQRSEFDLKLLKGIPHERSDVLAALEKEQSFACVPLISGEEVIGTLSFTSSVPHFFDGRRLQLLDDFVHRASLALGAVRQMERLEEMSREFDRVLNVERLEALWPRIAEQAQRLFLCEVASISSFNTASNELRREAVAAMPGCDYQEQIGETIKASDEPGCGLSRWIAKAGGIHRLEGCAALNHPHLSDVGPSYHARLPSGRLKSIMLARLDTPEGKPMGVMRVVNRKGRKGERGFTEFDEALIRLLSTKLAMAIERLKLFESRNRAIATTAHDLKTPLQNIRVTLESFLEGAFRLPDDVEELRMSYNSCKLLDAFILSTIEVAQGKPDLARVRVEEIDARALVEEVVEVLKPKFQDPQSKDHRWSVVTEIASNAERIWGDRQDLLRLLLNLCHNAWKHGRATREGLENGTQQNLVEIGLRCDGDLCCLRVADRGQGLAGARLRPLAGGPITQEDRGQGVGLASASLIAEAHRGKLTFGRRADGLSGFQVELVWNQKDWRESATLAP
jgi:GAF domain-containing protein